MLRTSVLGRRTRTARLASASRGRAWRLDLGLRTRRWRAARRRGHGLSLRRTRISPRRICVGRGAGRGTRDIPGRERRLACIRDRSSMSEGRKIASYSIMLLRLIQRNGLLRRPWSLVVRALSCAPIDPRQPWSDLSENVGAVDVTMPSN